MMDKNNLTPQPGKQHQFVFPQDARYVFRFPDGGKLTNEDRVQEMIDGSGGGGGGLSFSEIQRIAYLTSACR